MKLSQLLGALAFAVIIASSPSIIQAQTASPQDEAQKNTSSELETPDEQQLREDRGVSDQEITVVGSRIRRNQFNTADPIQLITREESVLAGFASTADILQSTAVTGGRSQINNSYGNYVTADGPGANTLSLRGLGITRSLILLNGRRMSPSGSRGQVGAADLNTLPDIMIDRIEILNTGASSIYGSDAVAGVVNVVTRTKVRGIEAEAQQNFTEHGGGMEQRYGVLFGSGGSNWDFSGSFEYYKRDEITNGQRSWARCQTQYLKASPTSAPGTGDFIDPLTGQPKCYTNGTTGEGGITIDTLGTPDLAGSTVALAPGVAAGYAGPCNRFRPNPAAGGALPGYECVGGGALALNIRDNFPPSLLNDSLVAPAETYTGYVQGRYDVGTSHNIELYTEVLATRRKSEQNGNRQLTIDYPYASPLIPPALQFPVPFLPAQPGGVTGTTPIGVRIFSDYGNYNNRQTVDFVKGVVGLRGDIAGGWRFDLYGMRSWSDSTYTTDLVLTSRLAQSLDVVPNGSGFACRNPLGNCVAAPVASPAVIAGHYPAAWLDYVTDPVTGHTAYRETTVNLTVDGPIFRLPGGNLQGAFGVERRTDSIDDEPSPDSVNNNLYGFASSSVTRGSDAVWEVFGEIEAPLLKDLPLVHSLTVNASGRYTNYRSYGAETTYKFGGLYEPFPFLGFRGSYGTSYRAPALYEQFLGATSGFQSQNGDPCNDWDKLPAASIRRRNCQSEGLPADFMATAPIQVDQVGGAASGLKAETSDAWTAGVVIQPEFGRRFGNLSLSADYFNIRVSNGVSQLAYTTILSQCYDNPDFRSNSICGHATRDAGAPYALKVMAGYVNISTSQVAGWDIDMRYNRQLGPGMFLVSAQFTKYDTSFNQTLPTDRIRDDVGSVGNPEWSGTFQAQYRFRNLTVRYGVEWLESTYSTADYIGIPQAERDFYIFETPDYFLHSASVRVDLERYSLILGVRNLFDTDPPEISAGLYNRAGNAPLYSGYDYEGRTFFVNARAKF